MKCQESVNVLEFRTQNSELLITHDDTVAPPQSLASDRAARPV